MYRPQPTNVEESYHFVKNRDRQLMCVATDNVNRVGSYTVNKQAIGLQFSPKPKPRDQDRKFFRCFDLQSFTVLTLHIKFHFPYGDTCYSRSQCRRGRNPWTLLREARPLRRQRRRRTMGQGRL